METDQLLELINEINQSLDRLQALAKKYHDDLIELSRNLAREARRQYVEKVKQQAEAMISASRPEIEKEAERVYNRYVEQASRLEKVYKDNWKNLRRLALQEMIRKLEGK
ncbi:MAG: hypothetical protein ACP5GH_01335 [Nitrososphaeria archaeon]